MLGHFRMATMTPSEEITEKWRLYLQAELPNRSNQFYQSIVRWLLGEELTQVETYSTEKLAVKKQAMDYRYRILRQRYFEVSPERAYRNLIQRLGSLLVIRNKISIWISLSRDRYTTVMDVLQEVIQDLLQNDNYLQQQLAWIAQCTEDPRLRNALFLTATEEYCLRPIRNQPLLLYRFVNYQKRTQRAGMTQVPTADFIRLVSEEIPSDDSEGSISLLDGQAVAQHQELQAQEEQQELRHTIAQRFETHLEEQVNDPQAVQWFRLYIQGKTQEEIAEIIGMPIKQVYRLREKVSYHAVRVFAQKNQPELVAEWLG
jgi:hypothetical protein